MIVQMDPEKPNTKITVEGSVLTCAGFRFHMGDQLRQVSEKSYDLEEWRGRVFRLWIGEDGRLTTESRPTQFALLAEVEVPPAYNTPATDEEGNPVLDDDGNPVMVPAPLDLEEVEVRVWPIPD